MVIWEQLDNVIPTRLWKTNRWILTVGVSTLKIELFINLNLWLRRGGRYAYYTYMPTHVCAHTWLWSFLQPQLPVFSYSCPLFPSTHQHIKRPRSASWHSSSSSQDLEGIFRSQRLAPEGRVLNQVVGSGNMSLAVVLLPFLGRAKTWAQGRPVPAGVGLPCAGHSCPKAHILGVLLPLGRSQTSSICQMVAPWCLLIPLQLPLPKKLGGQGGETWGETYQSDSPARL